MNEFAVEYRRMSKPREVEGLADLYLIRPVGALLVQVLRHVPGITPTWVSILAVLAGWWCGWLYYGNSLAGAPTVAALWGALAMLLHSGLDSADGQLARLTGRSTDVGRLVDGFCDNLAFFGIYLGVWIGYALRGGAYPWTVFVLGWIAGAAHSLQSALSEHARLSFQAYVGDRYRLDRHRPEAIAGAIHDATGPLGGFFERLYQGYYGQQRLLVPSGPGLERRIDRLSEERPELVADLGRLWERYQTPVVRYSWLLASNVHKASIVLCAFVPAWGDGFFAGLGMCWFYMIDLMLILPMLWQMRRQVRAHAGVEAVLIARERGAGARAAVSEDRGGVVEEVEGDDPGAANLAG